MNIKDKLLTMKEKKQNKIKPEDFPIYPVGDDIYARNKEEENIDPEDVSMKKKPNTKDKLSATAEEEFADDESGRDLDVPGADLDDEQEDVGSEDEENNYYSLGGDEHNDLDEEGNK